MEKNIQKLLSLIPAGRENAVSMQQLADTLGLDKRAVRAAVMRARESGEIIAGDTAGYYIPSDKGELRRYYFMARKRSISGLNALKAARRKLRELEGQLSLGEAENAESKRIYKIGQEDT